MRCAAPGTIDNPRRLVRRKARASLKSINLEGGNWSTTAVGPTRSGSHGNAQRVQELKQFKFESRKHEILIVHIIQSMFTIKALILT